MCTPSSHSPATSPSTAAPPRTSASKLSRTCSAPSMKHCVNVPHPPSVRLPPLQTPRQIHSYSTPASIIYSEAHHMRRKQDRDERQCVHLHVRPSCVPWRSRPLALASSLALFPSSHAARSSILPRVLDGA
ncbi:hypothetical protein PYCCODRAFT_713479 [Trametes coccinea BRFM310]|uniref:Uncharacterized protein n=1 Tax=Trametes coccinea (strain BRFM310) TaxID=1353009 RepID=A0A1Y2IG13_TRAC3|nr:hypothetical protein PYCCODRAFT_713479 [Trametes coccinea BRFM310]